MQLEVIAHNAFPVAANETVVEMYEFAFPSGSKIKVSVPQKNPEACVRCHGKNPHPIWGSYPKWPHALGESDDFLKTQEEKDQLAEFRKHQAVQVLRPPNGSEFTPYQPEGTTVGDAKFRPNMRLGKILGRLSAHRLFERIRNQPAYEFYRHIMLAIALECPEQWSDDEGASEELWGKIRRQVAMDRTWENRVGPSLRIRGGALDALAHKFGLRNSEIQLRRDSVRPEELIDRAEFFKMALQVRIVKF